MTDAQGLALQRGSREKVAIEEQVAQDRLTLRLDLQRCPEGLPETEELSQRERST